MKKALRLLLLALIGTLCAISLISCGCEESSKLAFELSSDESYYIVTGIGDYGDSELIIPSEHKKLPVKEIAADAFANNTDITAITIPDSITAIGHGAFVGCTNVTEVNYNAKGVADPQSNNHFIFKSLGLNTEGVTVTIGKDVERIPSLLFSYDEHESEINNITAVRVQNDSALTEIGDNAFYACSKIAKISFGTNSRLSKIGSFAFAKCRALTSISIPSSVTEIGSMAFMDCTAISKVEISSLEAWCRIKFKDYGSNPAYFSCALTLNGSILTDVVIPVGVTDIGDNTFSFNTAITSISIPEDVVSIGKLESCTSLAQITYNAKNATCVSYPFASAGNATDKIKIVIGQSVQKIPAELFGSNAHITTLDLSKATSLTEIGERAFYNATSLESVTLPDSLKLIGADAFFGCDKVFTVEDGISYIGTWAIGRNNAVPNNLTIRDGTTHIAQDAISGCVALKTLTLPASLVSIGEGAFYSCVSLSAINLPEGTSLSHVGRDAFKGCSALIDVRIPSGDVWAKISFANETANPLSQGNVKLLVDGSPLLSLKLESVEKIGTYAFAGYKYFSNITLNGIKEIGEGAFKSCASIASISMSSEHSVAIGDSAFYGITSLSALYFDLKNTTSSDKENLIFYNAGGAGAGITVTIGTGVEGIAEGLFKPTKYDSEKGFSYPPKITRVVFSEGGALKVIPSSFSHLSTLASVSIPEGVTALGGSCFYKCTSLTSVNLPSTITEIGGSAFSDSALAQINLPEGLKVINSAAFASTPISSIELPSTLRIIGASAFWKCSSLKSISDFPSALDEIGDFAFYESGISGIISLPANLTKLGEGVFIRTGITEAHIPNTVTYLGARVFEGCASLTAVTLPEGITSLEFGVFNGCSKLAQVTIPTGVTKIGGSAFQACSSLTQISLPEGITEIGSAAFKQCHGITSIQLPSTLISIGDEAFFYLNKITSIVVPSSVKTIGAGAFSGCSALTEMTLPFIGKSAEGEKDFVYSGGTETYFGYIFGNDLNSCVEVHQFVRGSLSNSSYTFKIPAGLTTLNITSSHIPSYSLSGCKMLKKINVTCDEISLPTNSLSSLSGVTEISLNGRVSELKNAAFSGCTELTTLKISDNAITTIGGWAFSGCAKLTSVPFGEVLTSIGESAFEGCAALTEITIPASVESIGLCAFKDCSALSSVTLAAPDGWSVSKNDESFGLALGLASRNAQYFKTDYVDYTWLKK